MNPNLWTVIYNNISICASAASLYPSKGCLYYVLVALGGPEVGYTYSAGQSQYFRCEAQVSEEYTDLHSAWRGTFLASCHVQAHNKTIEQLLTCGAIWWKLNCGFWDCQQLFSDYLLFCRTMIMWSQINLNSERCAPSSGEQFLNCLWPSSF